MDKKRQKGGFFRATRELIKEEITLRKNDGVTLFFDALVFFIAFIYARCHVAFGVYPLHIAFVSVLPNGVWISLVGAVIGSLSLGKTGIVGALGAVTAVFLRTLISSPHRSEDEPFLFREPLLLRISSAIITSFLGGLYVVVDIGFSLSSVFYLGGAVFLSAAFAFVFFGVFDGGITLRECLLGNERILGKKRLSAEKYSFVMAVGSFLFYVFFVSRALFGYEILGISPAYMIATALTLFVAKRFGSLAALTVGFVATFSLNPMYAVGFGILGLIAGAFSSLGRVYTAILGGAGLVLWCVYVGGVLGLLSVLPEYGLTTLLVSPFLRRISEGKKEETSLVEEKAPKDMVNTATLAYINSTASLSDKLFDTLTGISQAVGQFECRMGEICESECRDGLINDVSAFCHGCEFFSDCLKESPAPCAEVMDEIATIIYKNKGFLLEDAEVLPEYCKNVQGLSHRLSSFYRGLFGMRGAFGGARPETQYELLSHIIREAGYHEEKRKMTDRELSEKIAAIARELGLCYAEARVLGDKDAHLILAGEDKDGSIITSKSLQDKISDAIGLPLSTAEYYRRDAVALFEASVRPSFSFLCHTVSEGGGNEQSGDLAAVFEGDSCLYSLISDGMGSGEVAASLSKFVADFLTATLACGATKGSIFHLLNYLIRSSQEESFATVDLFEFDTVTGESCFYKCGAADSYIKRGDSVFRIRSESAPVGLMKNIDAEKIRVKVNEGDYVIMISDGISEQAEDSTPLLEAINKCASDDLCEYSRGILESAKKRTDTHDDMTVTVLKIVRIG